MYLAYYLLVTVYAVYIAYISQCNAVYIAYISHCICSLCSLY